MQRRFEGRRFLVTGAGTGFGAALALRAAQEGAAQVLIHYRSSADGAELTAGRVREAGAEAEIVQGDITSWKDIQRMAAWAFEEHDGIDVLVNNVGDMASGQASWKEVTEEAIDHVLAVDIKGTMLMVHEFGQRMVSRDGGAGHVAQSAGRHNVGSAGAHDCVLRRLGARRGSGAKSD